MKVLSVSTMFPNPTQEVFGIFVYKRLEKLKTHCDLTVLSPIPWFPFAHLLKRYNRRIEIPDTYKIGELDVTYIRFFSIPKYLKFLDGFFLGLSLIKYVKNNKDLNFDIIDAHIAYPDGFGALILSFYLKKPYSVTLRGHDINNTPKYKIRKFIVKKVLKRASYIISVADALKNEAIRLGADPAKSETIPNGVDKEDFKLMDKKECREKLGLPQDKKIILSVGHLVERKGIHIVVEALGILKKEGIDFYYVIVGGPGEEGDYRSEIETTIKKYSLQDNVYFAGTKPSKELKYWYNSADVFCLASSKEGRPNVILEAMACGTPSVATNIWGTPEILTSERLGILVERNPPAISKALFDAFNKNWDTAYMIEYAKQFSWDEVGKKLADRFQNIISNNSNQISE